jgi:hypothetical protein
VVFVIKPKVRLTTLAEILINLDVTKTEFNNCFIIYITFRQIMICHTKQHLVLKKASENELEYHNNSIRMLEISIIYLLNKVPIKISKRSCFFHKIICAKTPFIYGFFCLFLFVYLKLSLNCRNKITYHMVNPHITQLISASR